MRYHVKIETEYHFQVQISWLTMFFCKNGDASDLKHLSLKKWFHIEKLCICLLLLLQCNFGAWKLRQRAAKYCKSLHSVDAPRAPLFQKKSILPPVISPSNVVLGLPCMVFSCIAKNCMPNPKILHSEKPASHLKVERPGPKKMHCLVIFARKSGIIVIFIIFCTPF